MIDLVDPKIIVSVEDFVTDYLKKHENGNVEEFYKASGMFIPFPLFKEIVYDMFKRYKLRRRKHKHQLAEYRLASDFPSFGRPYVKRTKTPKNHEEIARQKKLSLVESCRDNSRVYAMDVLLRKARG